MLLDFLDQRVIPWDAASVAGAGAGSVRARLYTRTQCPDIPIQESEDVPAPVVLPSGTGVLVAQGAFDHPDQSSGASVDQLVPAQIPFQPRFVVFNVTGRGVTGFGDTDNDSSGHVVRAISMSTGFALYSDTPGAARQFFHARSVPFRNFFGSENHKANRAGILGFYGYNFATLPGMLSATLHEYVPSGDNFDLLVRWAIPRDGVGGPSTFPEGGLVRWTAFGGPDITDVALIHWGLQSRFDTTWTQDVTTQYPAGPAIGFKPDFLWNQYWVAAEADSFNNGRKHGIGWANCAGEQVTVSMRDQTFVVPTQTAQWEHTDAMMVLRRPEGKFVISLDAMLDDGFRISVDNPDASLAPPEGGCLTLAVKGLSSKISRLVAPATSVAAAAVSPVALLTMSGGEPPQETEDEIEGSRLSYGIAVAGAQWCMANDFPNGQSFTPVGPFFLPSSGGAFSVDYDGSILAKLVAPSGEYGFPGPVATVDARAVADSLQTLSWPEDDDSGLEVLTCILGSGGGGTCSGPAVGFPLQPPCLPFLPPLCVVPETA